MAKYLYVVHKSDDQSRLLKSDVSVYLNEFLIEPMVFEKPTVFRSQNI